MSGICEPKTEGIYVVGDYGGIAIQFRAGEEWKFQQDSAHADRLIATQDCRLSISLTIDKFYEVFKVKEHK